MADEEKLFRDKNSPYQFFLPADLKEQGIRKSEENGVPIAQFMKMAWEQFVDRPIEESMKLLQTHKRRKRRPKGLRNIKLDIKKKGVTLNK